MTDEVELADRLLQLDCLVGRSKNGRLLRVDGRPCSTVLNHEMLERILASSTLRELYLPDSRGFLNEHIQEIAALKKLKVLDVENSDFSDESIQLLSECENLQVLNVRNTRVTQDCVTRLRKVMIGTRIVF